LKGKKILLSLTINDWLRSFGYYVDEIEAPNIPNLAHNTGRGLYKNKVLDMELGLIPLLMMFIIQVLFNLYEMAQICQSRWMIY